MKILIKILIIIALIVLLGALPIKIIGIAFDWLSVALKTLANWIDFFGWGGIF